MALILVIDDDDMMRGMLRKMLLQAGHDVVDAPDGEAGLSLLQKTSAELVITDIMMPEKDGLEVIRAIRRDLPAAKIIAISGGGKIGRRNFLAEAREFGADETLLKPLDRSKFLESVKRLLEG